MSYTVGVVAFVVALLVSVMLHEAGHFLTAKGYGMKASRFFVGFGPTLWSFRRGETEYGVKAIPAGGFVKIDGMTPLEEVAPGDETRAFYNFPTGKRVVVLSAGSAVHLLLAVFIVFGVIAATGVDPINVRTSTTIDQVEQCIPQPTETACSAADPAAPALGKLRAGDRVTAVAGVPVSSYDQMSSALRARPGRPTAVTFVRAGKTSTVTLTPVAVRDGDQTIGKIGVAPRIDSIPVSVAGAVPKTFTTLGDFATSTVSALGGLPHEVAQIVSGKPRNPNGAASVVDVARVSGQITSSGGSIGAIVASLLLIVAELNFFVGIFNMLPLLPLDGGHVAIAGFEAARSRLYRLVGRPDPGRVDIMKVLPLTYAVVAAFVGLSLILLYAGITNPIKLQ